jgi:hypothetical protein
MTSPTASVFGAQNHPSGQINIGPRRTIASRANALIGHRLDMVRRDTMVSMVATWTMAPGAAH